MPSPASPSRNPDHGRISGQTEISREVQLTTAAAQATPGEPVALSRTASLCLNPKYGTLRSWAPQLAPDLASDNGSPFFLGAGNNLTVTGVTVTFLPEEPFLPSATEKWPRGALRWEVQIARDGTTLPSAVFLGISLCGAPMRSSLMTIKNRWPISARMSFAT